MREVIGEWVISQGFEDLGYNEDMLQEILDYKLDKKDTDTCSASEEQLEEVSQWMEDNQGEFEYFLGGDNDWDSDMASEMYEDAIEKV